MAIGRGSHPSGTIEQESTEQLQDDNGNQNEFADSVPNSITQERSPFAHQSQRSEEVATENAITCKFCARSFNSKGQLTVSKYIYYILPLMLIFA